MQPTLFDIRNANWKEWRYFQRRRDELKELEKQRQETKTRSRASLEAWDKRKRKI